MELKITQAQRSFSVYLHNAILDSSNYLVGASIFGLQTAVKAVLAALNSGYEGEITLDQNNIKRFRASYFAYRLMDGPLENELHLGMAIRKEAVVTYKKAIEHGIIVVAMDGNLEQAVGKRLIELFDLPEEWENDYYRILPKECMEELQVIKNPEIPACINMKALRLNIESEKSMFDLVGDALQKKVLIIPPSDIQGTFDPSMNSAEYLKANAPILARQINENGSIYQPGDKLSPHHASIGRISFPAQAIVSEAVVKAFEQKSHVIVCGDMGTGKTQVSNSICHLLHKIKDIRRSVVTCPSKVVPKWVKELKVTLPYAKVRVISSTEEASRFAQEVKKQGKPSGLDVTVISIDRAKLGPEPWCSAIWKRVKGAKYYAWHCPDCYQPLPSAKEYKAYLKKKAKDPDAEMEVNFFAQWSDLAYGEEPPMDKKEKLQPNGLPKGFQVKWKTRSRLRKCPHCNPDGVKNGAGTRLWRPANKSRGETRMKARWFGSRILKSLGQVFDLYIADEVHETKGHDSGRGYAFGQMVKSAKRILSLTGTLTNGKATSIKELLWRTNARELIDNGFSYGSTMQWAERYGVVEKTYSSDDVTITDEGVVTVRRGAAQQIVEKPGISPELTATYLLDKTVFFELSDLGLPLPELKEIPIFIKMDEEHQACYNKLHSELHDACAKARAAGAKGAFSVFNPTTLNYCDRPDLGVSVHVGQKCIEAKAFSEDYYHAKERELVDLVKKELAEGRGSIIYTYYSGMYRINERLQKVLAAHGIDSVILSSSVSSDDRLDWLEEQERKGTQVIIANMELLDTSFDLIYWPTIFNFQLNFKVLKLRQCNRRNWRIDQFRECRIYYLVYDGTQQMNQFKHVMAGRGHSMFVEGRIDRSDLAKYVGEGAKSNKLAYDIAMCVAEADLKQRWIDLARKDMDQNIVMLSGDNFKEELEKAKVRLKAETLRMCGVAQQEAIDSISNAAVVKQEEDSEKSAEPAELISLSQLELFTGIASRPVKTATPIKPGISAAKRRRKKAHSNQLTLFDFIDTDEASTTIKTRIVTVKQPVQNKPRQLSIFDIFSA